jgi:hypothetical protein
MSWVHTDATKSGYGVLADAPDDLVETACLVKEFVVQDDMPAGDGWIKTEQTIVMERRVCTKSNYVASGYVAAGYVEGNAGQYVADGYVESGYVEKSSSGDGRYVASGYVKSGYVTSGDSDECERYVAEGYVAEGYTEGSNEEYEVVVSAWYRWLHDPVGMPYVRDGFFDDETNPTPCVPYSIEEDMIDDLYGMFPFKGVAAAVLASKNSFEFGLTIPFDKRADSGVRAMRTEGVNV